MFQIKFNKNKIIPDPNLYIKILFSSFIIVYILMEFIKRTFPIVATLNEFWSIVFWTILIVYLTELIDIKINGQDFF